MWKRFIRSVRAFFYPNAADTVEKRIGEMLEQVPRMNSDIVAARVDRMLLTKEKAHYSSQTADLAAKLKAAILAKQPDDVVNNWIGMLNKAHSDLANNTYMLALTLDEIARTSQVKVEHLFNMREATESLSEAKATQWLAKIADADADELVIAKEEMARRMDETSRLNLP